MGELNNPDFHGVKTLFLEGRWNNKKQQKVSHNLRGLSLKVLILKTLSKNSQVRKELLMSTIWPNMCRKALDDIKLWSFLKVLGFAKMTSTSQVVHPSFQICQTQLLFKWSYTELYKARDHSRMTSVLHVNLVSCYSAPQRSFIFGDLLYLPLSGKWK